MTSSNPSAFLSLLHSLASSSSTSLNKMTLSLLKILSSRANGSKQLTSAAASGKMVTSVKSVVSALGTSNVPQLLDDVERRLQLLTKTIECLPLQTDTPDSLPRASVTQVYEIHGKIDSIRPVLMRLTDLFDALPPFDQPLDADYILDKLYNIVNSLLAFLQCITDKKPVLEVIYGVRSRTAQDLQRLEMRFDDLFDAIYDKLPLQDHPELVPLENAAVNGFDSVISDWQAPLRVSSVDSMSQKSTQSGQHGLDASTQPVWELSSFSGGKFLDDREPRFKILLRLLHFTFAR